MHYFSFIDETGITAQERFFGIGLLCLPTTDSLYEALSPIYDKIKKLSVENKNQRLDALYNVGKYEELLTLAKGSKTFELKYDRITNANQSLYIEFINKYFSVSGCRFTALIIDKENYGISPQIIHPGTWEAYVTYSALLLSTEAVSLKIDALTAFADNITKPKKIATTFEYSIHQEFNRLCIKNGEVLCKHFSSTRIESNSHLFIQLVDVLLGCLVFDLKMKHGLVSEKLVARRMPVVQRMKKILGKENLSGSFTRHVPNYFSVREMF